MNSKQVLRHALLMSVFFAVAIGGINFLICFKGIVLAFCGALVVLSIGGAFVVPTAAIAMTVQCNRYRQGLITGLVGWSMGYLITLLLAEAAFTIWYGPDVGEASQGLGILGGVLWMLGLALSPVMGKLAEIVGRRYDRARAGGRRFPHAGASRGGDDRGAAADGPDSGV